MKKQSIILLLLLMANFLPTTNSSAQIGKPDQILGKTVEEGEKVLGHPAFVDGIGTMSYKNTGNMKQVRFYKAPGLTRIVLTRTMDEKAPHTGDPEHDALSPVVQRVEYQIPKGSVKTWQQAFTLLNLNAQGVSVKPLFPRDRLGALQMVNFPGGYGAIWTPSGTRDIKDGTIIDKANHLLTVYGLDEPFTRKSRTSTPPKKVEATQLIPLNQEKPSPAALKPIPLNFMALRGKNLEAYEAILGKPISVEDEGFQTLRYYKVPGFVRVILFVDKQKQNPPLVTAAEVQFDKSEVPSWKEALTRIGFYANGVVSRYDEKYDRPTMYAGEPVKMACTFLTQIEGTTSAQWFEAGLPRADRTLPANISGVTKPVPPADERTGAIDPKNHRLYFFIDNSVNLIAEAKWESVVIDDAAATLRRVSQVGGSEAGDGWEFTITKPGKFDYSAQFFPIIAALQNGKRYRIAFEARADVPSNLYITTEMHDAPYLDTGLPRAAFRLTEAWQICGITFRARNGDKGPIKAPSFRRSLAPGTVWGAKCYAYGSGGQRKMTKPLFTAASLFVAFAGIKATYAQTAAPPLLFPVVKGAEWSDTFGAPRTGHTHQGQDLMAPKLRPLIACFSGTITLHRNQGTAGNWITLHGTGANVGWRAEYMHLNNDSPGTNDGAGGDKYAFAPNLKNGDAVKAGQFLGYVGNSGNAETTGPHCHFELHGPQGVVNAAFSLHAAHLVKNLDGTVVLAAAAAPAGPLHVAGVVLAAFPDQGEAIVKVTSVTEFGGKPVQLSPPRVKRLILSGSLRAAALGKGTPLTAEGRDMGRGRPLRVARLTIGGSKPISDTEADVTEDTNSTAVDGAGERGRTTRQQTFIPPPLPERLVLDGFERGAYAGWRMSGDCWTNAPEPTYGSSTPRSLGAMGRYYLSTAHARVGSYYPVSGTGVALSPEFPVTHTKMRFLIGGGNYPDECCLNLRVGDTIVRTATGSGADRMFPVEWDISPFVGKRATLEIVDKRAFGQRAYLLLDQLEMDGLPPPATIEAEPIEPTVLETADLPNVQAAPKAASLPKDGATAGVDGTAPKAFVLLPDGTRVEGTNLLTLTATGYGPGENGPWGDQTALGTKVGYGTVAVDPKVIPLRKHLWVEGYGFCIALDTGGAIKGMRIDLGHNTDAEAALEGKTKRRVLILD